MMKCRPRQYQAVHDYDVYARGHPRFEMTQHSAGGGAVQVQLVALSAKKRRNHKGLPIHVEPGMSYERIVQNRVDSLRVVRAAIRQSSKLRPRSQLHSFSRVNV